ncbi:BMR1 [Verticillium alfalfae VaMs.102]|uniref:BMR1 n=1 Tax=Verticillium alfalfae (strain VaMs.102 / ATCC MYA-4576 / FGSC 10136) TaxID=526221 RepID=C9SWB5_VERA1|nr:BMR1 [Verticillium alfalfae VaMs.102]EEY23080.1 BMR1 [Verticillium alfalfae VaMs.102]
MADKAFEKAEEATVDGQNLRAAEQAVAGTNTIPDEKSALKDDKSSVSTANDPENAREEARRQNPDGFSNLHRGISVEQAEADFAELQRELSGVSRASRVNSRRKSHGDAEKAWRRHLPPTRRTSSLTSRVPCAAVWTPSARPAFDPSTSASSGTA